MSRNDKHDKKGPLADAIEQVKQLEIPGALARHLRLKHDSHEQIYNLDTLQKRSAVMVRDLSDFLEAVAPKQYDGEIQGALQGYLEAVINFREVMGSADDNRRRPEGVATNLSTANRRLADTATILGKKADKIREIIMELEPDKVREYQRQLVEEYKENAAELMAGAYTLHRGQMSEMGVRTNMGEVGEQAATEHRDAIATMMARRRLQNVSEAPDAIAPMMVGMVYLSEAMEGALGKLRNRPKTGRRLIKFAD